MSKSRRPGMPDQHIVALHALCASSAPPDPPGVSCTARFRGEHKVLELRNTQTRILSRMTNAAKVVGYCALTMLVALYMVGVASNGVIRHIVQTLPLWFPIVLGLRQQEVAKWAALPCFIIWLVLMSLIWLFLLGWANVLSGHFSPSEVASTLVVGAASLVGLVAGFRWPARVRWRKALSVAAIFAVLQLLALRISFLPFIAKDRF